MKKWCFLILFFGLSAASLAWVWLRPVASPGEEKKAEALVSVRVTRVERGELRRSVAALGIVEPDQAASARVAVSAPGVIAAVRCVEGQRVEKDALLFELDARSAEVAASFAEKTFERQKKLAMTESTSQKLVQESELQLALSRTQLALLQIRAPISGSVARVNVKAGESADLTTVLAELVDLERLVVSFNVPSIDLASFRVGQSVELIGLDSTNALITSLSFISPQLDAKTDSGVARARLPANVVWRPGQMLKVRVMVAERKNCLVVPIASVAKDPSGSAFIALVEGEKAVLKPVKTGLREGDRVEVEGEGVEPGNNVVTDGAYGLIMTQQFATRVRIVNE